jgi:transaldolase
MTKRFARWQRLEKGMTEARQVLDRLAEIGINLEEVAQQLEDDGIEKFVLAFDRLMDTLEKKRAETFREPVDRQTLHNRQSVEIH